MSLPRSTDIVIVGAGAAGLTTAIFARQVAAAGMDSGARREAAPDVLLLDGARKPGAKILVSGGTRCNVTNAHVTETDYWTSGRRATIRRVLRGFTVRDTVAWFAHMGVALHEEENGKLYPDSNRARDVLEALLGQAERCGVILATEARVRTVTRTDSSAPFRVDTGRGEIHARVVVLATGGQALPKSGSDGAGYRLAAALGHTIVPTTPALAPLTLTTDGDSVHQRLSGVSQHVDLAVWVDGAIGVRFTGSLLWTHFGVSGPVALDASRHIERARIQRRDVHVTINMMAGQSFDDVDQDLIARGVDRPKLTVSAALRQRLPDSVAGVLLDHLSLPATQPLSQIARSDRRRLSHALTSWRLRVTGTRGDTFAEATAGGVDVAEVDPSTMQSRRCEGLYLVGEVLDVDGRLGGFNFQWAWSSGRVAGGALARRSDWARETR